MFSEGMAHVSSSKIDVMDGLYDQHAVQLEVLRCDAPSTATGCSEHQRCARAAVMLVQPASFLLLLVMMGDVHCMACLH